jgi:class III poly(R)-hydroxyalkanoic acid synthase PhaE subunit
LQYILPFNGDALMNWTDQMQQLMGSWTEAQKNMASQWTTAMNQAPAPGMGTAGDWSSKWREMAATNFESHLSKMGGVPGSVAGRMFSGSQTYNQFVDFISGALNSIAPKMDTGGDWAKELNQYMEMLKGKMGEGQNFWMKPESAAASAGDMNELWTIFMNQGKSFSAPWQETMEAARGHMGGALGGDQQAISNMFKLFTDTFDSTMGKYTNSPNVGYSREYQDKLSNTFAAWAEMKKAEVLFNTEMTSVGMRSMEKFIATLKEKAQKGEKIENTRKLFDLWVSVAEKTYYETASTEAFAKTQADLLNASMRHRIEEKGLVEVLYKAVHLPTRTELDDAYKHMHEMRRQVKKLVKTVATLEDEITSLNEVKTAAAAAEKKAVSAEKKAAAAEKKAASAEKKAATAEKKAAPAAKKPAPAKTSPRKTTATKPAATRTAQSKTKES